MNYRTLCRAIAVVLGVSLVVQPQALIVVPLFEQGGAGAVYGSMIAVIIAAALAAIAGLWHCRWWGFLAFYAYAVTATIALGTALVPFITALAPDRARLESVIAINTAAVLFVGIVQWRHGKASENGA